uniref:Amine oxidase domain-containing protein n=1 Tax=Megaselia scalaris TaxID=36166 RepID=T1GYJ5_MEGSC
MKSTARIVIIGAGASGISAATKLVSFGFKNIIILEAQDRIGGRIYTIPFGDNFIDMGAQWCHGEKDNVVYELVKDKGYLDTTGNIYEDYEVIRSNGEKISDKTSEKLKEIIDIYLLDKKKDLPGFGGSLASYLRDKFLKTLKYPEYSDIDRKVAEEFLKFYHKYEVSMECCDSLFDVSGEGHLDYWNCEGDIGLNWKDKGFTMILRSLLNSNGTDFGILNKKIFLRKEVTDILWDPTGAIQGLGVGTVNKAFIHFEERWWDKDWCGFCILWREDDLKDIRESEFFWLEDVFGFYTVKYQPNVLSSWITGTSAKYVESLPKQKQMEGFIYLLERFLKRRIPKPIDFIATSWYTNKFIKMSYSHRSMETDHLKTGASELAEPILSPNGRPLLQFAGEATHNHYYSTVHGAVESGWREADRLNQYYSDTKSHL